MPFLSWDAWKVTTPIIEIYNKIQNICIFLYFQKELAVKLSYNTQIDKGYTLFDVKQRKNMGSPTKMLSYSFLNMKYSVNS